MKTAMMNRDSNGAGETKSDEANVTQSSNDRNVMQEKMKAATRPSAAHRALDAFVGDWKAEVKSWCEPGGPAQQSKATAKAYWIMDGHFLEEEFRGEMMGRPFVGQTLMGYDNTKGVYQNVWISDMQTSMVLSEGKGSDNNRLITLEGRTDCPMSGQQGIPIKLVYRVIDTDRHVLEMFNNGQKSMEITYTRA